MESLVPENWFEISRWSLSHRDLQAVRCCNEKLLTNINAYLNKYKVGSYFLNGYQQQAIKFIEDNNNKLLYLKIPMSGGKTVIGLTLALKHKGTSVIICPSKVIEVWIQEYEKMKIKSKTLSVHMLADKYNKYTIGHTYIHNNKNNIHLISSTRSTLPWQYNEERIRKILNENTENLVVIDEAHLKGSQTACETVEPLCSKLLCLSAASLPKKSYQYN